MEKLIDYLEALMLYAQKHTEIFFKKLIIKSIWFVLVFFTFCIGFAYLSISIYWSFERFAGHDPIVAALLTSLIFLASSFLFLRFLLSR